MKKLRIGVVGLGDISRVYLDNLKKYSDYVTIEACASRTLEKAQKKLTHTAFRTRIPVQKSLSSKRMWI